MPGYTVHRCYYCNLEYYTDFTDIEPDNHLWYVESDEHFCANGCEAHGAWADHTMADGKCTVCGYWPGHTEHQWLTDSNGHFCTIPGCEHSVYEKHTMEEGSCACTVCGHIEHQYENGKCQNCGTGCQHESITLDEESITDVDGEPVVITLTDDGYYATEQTIDLNDAVNIPYTDIEFTVPAVSYTRDISAYTGSNWGTLCLPFDYTIADATSAGLSIYEFTAASAEAVTVTHKTEGTVKYGTPVLFKKTGEGEGKTLTLSATSTKMGFDQGVIDDISGLQLWGTFEPMDVTSGYYLDANDGKLYSIETYCSEKSKESLTIPAYRAYFAGNVGAPERDFEEFDGVIQGWYDDIIK